MKKLITISLVAMLAVNAMANFAVSTDRVSYTGTVTKYATLADAQAGANAIGTYAIPDRATDAPYDTGYRDVGIYFVDDMASYDTNANIFLTAWWYTTNPDNGEYSGWGNPNNTNTGFLQIYDDDGNTDTSISGSFQNKVGSDWTEFALSVSGLNATYDPDVSPNDYARFWPAPTVGGAAVISVGDYISYDLDIVFGGLTGVESAPGEIEATGHPTSVTGSFNALFENKNATYYPDHASADPSQEGFYVIEYTFGMDNWAYGQGEDLNGAFSDSYFATVPEPATMALLGLGALVLRKRK